MTLKEIAVKLYSEAGKQGLLWTLYTVFGKNYKVSMPFSGDSKNTSVDCLNFGTRANNATHRNGIKTVGELLELIEAGTLRVSLNNVGVKTETEIKATILIFGYMRLSEKEKIEFWENAILGNVNRI